MRIAVVSDIHGNGTAFEAVLKDLNEDAPDEIFHGGDLADAGSNPSEIVDLVRELGWRGVVGNTDEMLFRPDSILEFAQQSPTLRPMLAVLEEMAATTREMLGQERLAWLGHLPRSLVNGGMTLMHASPENLWRAPAREASDTELEAVYGRLKQPVVVYAHIHQPYVKELSGWTIANTGSVGLSYDGDCRAAYLLLDASGTDFKVTLRRVEYDVDREIRRLANSGLPHADWVARILRSGRPLLP